MTETATTRQLSGLSAFFIRIVAMPGVIERVLLPFTVNSLVPQGLVARLRRSDHLFVCARFLGIEAKHASIWQHA